MFRNTFLICSLLATVAAFALPVTAQESEPLVVGVYHAPPFAIQGDDGWDGIGVHLWRDAAQELDVDYTWRAIDPESMRSHLSTGVVDVVVNAVPTPDAEDGLDFTHSYFVSTIGYAEPAQRTVRDIAKAFFSPRFWKIALWLSLAWLAVGLLAWLFERSANEDQFGGGRWRGAWAGFWWAAVTMSTIGYGDKAPKSVGGRIVALIWMLVAMAITAVLTAALTSILTTGNFGTTDFPGDLTGMSVGTVEGAASADFLEGERIPFHPFEEPAVGLEAVGGDSIGIFVHDAAVLRYEKRSIGFGVRVYTTDYAPQHHAFALPEESMLLEPLNVLILDRIEEPAWTHMLGRFLDSRDR